jgi:hypothetical protein
MTAGEDETPLLEIPHWKHCPTCGGNHFEKGNGRGWIDTYKNGKLVRRITCPEGAYYSFYCLSCGFQHTDTA